MRLPVVVLLGLGFGVGAWLVVTGLLRRPRGPQVPLTGRLRRVLAGPVRLRLAAALTAALVVGVWTRWPVAALLAAVAVWTLPGLLAGARATGVAQAKLEAIAAWTESLRGTLAAGAGLEQVVIATAASAPEPIRGQVQRLAAALRAGVRLPEALRAFADDLDHPDADRVVAALLLAATGRVRNLADQLGALAGAARDQAAARLRVDTEWATTRTSVRVIIAITLSMAVGMILVNREFLEPYDSPAGQLVLLVVGGMFATGYAWLARLSRIAQPPRILAGAAGPQAVSRS